MDIINKETRRELISALQERYRLADREAKGGNLDDFVEVSDSIGNTRFASSE